jgi:hypothetical protein
MRPVPDLKPEGIAALRESPRSRDAQYPTPPIALTADGPREIERPSDLEELDPATPILWTWPGRWRSLPFQTTAAEIRYVTDHERRDAARAMDRVLTGSDR